MTLSWIELTYCWFCDLDNCIMVVFIIAIIAIISNQIVKNVDSQQLLLFCFNLQIVDEKRKSFENSWTPAADRHPIPDS